MVFIVSKLLQLCYKQQNFDCSDGNLKLLWKSFCLQLFSGFPGDNVTFANGEVLILCFPSNLGIWYLPLSTHCCAYNPWHSLSGSQGGSVKYILHWLILHSQLFFTVLCNVFIMLNFILLPFFYNGLPCQGLRGQQTRLFSNNKKRRAPSLRQQNSVHAPSPDEIGKCSTNTDPQIDTWADGGTHICLLHDLKRGFFVTTVMAKTPALWTERASSLFPVLTPSPATWWGF